MTLIKKQKFRPHIIKFSLITAFLLSALVCGAAAQNSRKKVKNNVLPRVGAIKDTEDVGRYITGGCDFHYLKLPGKASTEEVIFVSTADGLLAMMNLGGSDTRLELVKTTLWYESSGNAFARHVYRAGKVSITVSFWQYSDYISDYPAKIVLRRGRTLRTIRALGMAQCDAI